MSGYMRMQLISVILFIISVGLIVGPVGAVVYTYREDLSGLVIPSQLKDLLQGDTSSFLNDANNDGDSFLGGLIEPVFVGSTVDSQTRTFTMTVNITNNFSYDLTLNSLSADVESTQNNYHLVTISLSEPVTMISGKASTVTVNGQWSQEAEALFLNNYSQEPSIDVALDNIIIDLNGIIVESTEPFPIGNIPLSLAA